MAEPEPLQILVDTDVQLASAGTPRRIIEAMRRHLRQHDTGSTSTSESPQEEQLNLIQTKGGQHRLPQGLLPKLTETCRRHGVPYAVVDRRSMVSCPAFRSRMKLDLVEQEALRRLLFRDSGVIIAALPQSRLAIALELVARRQQRTLVLTPTKQTAETWLGALRRDLNLAEPTIQLLDRCTPEARVVVGRYEAISRLPADALQREFGMAVFDGLSDLDGVTLMKAIRASSARYLLGLAASPQRADGLHGPLFLALGGVATQLAPPRAAVPLRLTCRFKSTSFQFPSEGRSQYQALVAALAVDADRNQLVAAEITAEARAGNPCLVLSERRDHLEQLASLLPADLNASTLTSGVHVADRSRIIARFEAGDPMVLLATGQIATESVCGPRVSRLFLTFPFSYTRRLERAVSCLLQPFPGKQDAILLDFDDPFVPPLHRAFEKRRQALLRLKAESDGRAQLTLPLSS